MIFMITVIILADLKLSPISKTDLYSAYISFKGGTKWPSYLTFSSDIEASSCIEKLPILKTASVFGPRRRPWGLKFAGSFFHARHHGGGLCGVTWSGVSICSMHADAPPHHLRKDLDVYHTSKRDTMLHPTSKQKTCMFEYLSNKYVV